MSKVTVVGAGAWGTALACQVARAGHDATLWAFESDVAEEITTKHLNTTYLAGAQLPPTIRATSELAASVDGAEIILLVPPSEHLRRVSSELVAHVPDSHGRAVEAHPYRRAGVIELPIVESRRHDVVHVVTGSDSGNHGADQ